MLGFPRTTTLIAHGYTLADIYDLAVHAVLTDHWRSDINRVERVSAAWSAVAAALCSADEPPHRRELVLLAREASEDVIAQDMKHRGVDKRGATFGEQRVSFERFWFSLPSSGTEDRVVDAVTLQQIWPQLKPAWQEAFLALAAHGDYADAAGSLGLAYGTFCARVRHGRMAFLRLWHEGEQPSSVWGRDKRQGRDNTGRTAVRVLARRARMAGAA
jgi:hypothetical protein